MMARSDRRRITAGLVGLGVGAVVGGSPRALAQRWTGAKREGLSTELGRRVDQLVGAHMKEHNILGLALAIGQNGNVTKATGYGWRDETTKTPVSPGTVFRIGSISKQFIASAIMLLVQDGKLSLENPLPKFVTDAPAPWQPITVRHLLTHTSGLVRDPLVYPRSSPTPFRQHIRRAYQAPLVTAPGKNHLYSNLGYFVLAEVLETASGQAWDPFLAARIFAPSGLAETAAYNHMTPARATGHSFVDGRHRVEIDYAVPRPSGGIHSTVLDMVRWDRALRGNSILSSASRRAMWAPTRLDDGRSVPYGFGWRIRSGATRAAIHHGGSVPGFGSHFLRQTEAGLSIVALSNAGAKQAKMERLGFRVAALLETAAGP